MRMRELFMRGVKRFKSPLMILAACVLGYGLFAASLGYYWDGWPFVWIPETYGNPGLVDYFAANRPVWGWLYRLTTPLIGNQPLVWQIFGVLLRFATGIAFWLLLRRLWPKENEAATWGALLFVLYPGFSQSAMANMYGHFYAVLTLVLLSLWLHLGLVASPKPRTSTSLLKDPVYWLSLVLAAYPLFATEYFFGLELLRPFLLFVPLPAAPVRERLKRVLATWWPFGVLLAVYAYWRVVIFGFQTYDPVVIASTNPAATTLGEWVVRIVGDLWLGGLAAWSVPFHKFLQADWASRLSWAAAGLAAVTAAGAFWLQRTGREGQTGFAPKAIVLGAVGLFLSGLPVWAIGLPIHFSFPNDRLTLPMMASASLLLVGLGYMLIRHAALRRGVFALLVGAALAFQFLMGADYARDWRYQQSMFWQLMWRAPMIEPGTLLIMNELQHMNITDNSLVAPINWLYAPGNTNPRLSYFVYFVPLRMQTGSIVLEPGQVVDSDFAVAEFVGNTDRSLALLVQPLACLRVLDPVYDQHYPGLPEGLDDALALSAPAMLIAPAGRTQPDTIFGLEPAHDSWCYYFQRADLARQQRDWAQVADLGDAAYTLEDHSNQATEHLPFIEGYAMVGRWDEAEALTREMLQIDRFTAPMLCNLWQRVEQSADAPKLQTIADMRSLTCE